LKNRIFSFCGVIGFLLASYLSATSTAHAVDAHHVLILNSYHAGYRGSDSLIEGIEKAFKESGENIEFKVEYLDSKQFTGASHDALVVNTLRAKYRTRHFELVLTTDDYAFNIAEKYHDELFGKTPVVFVGTNYFDSTRVQGRSSFIGIDESPSFADTLKLMLSLHPETNRIVAMHDNSETGELNSGAFNLAAADVASHITIDSLTGLTMEEVLDAVKGFSLGTLAVYFTSSIKNNAGTVISSNAALRSIAAASSVPIYGGWSFNLGHGIVGGRLIDLNSHGELAGQLAVRLIRGESIATLERITPSPNIYMFDYDQLVRFDIDSDLLPEGSTIISQPASFIEKHQTGLLIVMTILLIVVVSVSFARLTASRRILSFAHDRLLESEEKLRNIAHHDALTGLANRVLFEANFNQAVLRVRRSGLRLAVMVIDLDGFKPINDTHGHDAGDEVLREVATRLIGLLRTTDFVARLGGDEFVVLLEGAGDTNTTMLIGEKVIGHLGLPMNLSSGTIVHVGASIGIAFLRTDESPQELLRRADLAMYEAKAAGKDCCRIAS